MTDTRSVLLSDFSLSDMIECGREIRQLAASHSTEESFCEQLVASLRRRFVAEDGESAFVLARIFKTSRFDALDENLRQMARAAMRDSAPGMKCLRLLATAGTQPAWNRVTDSIGHRVIPLPSPEAVEQLPMISQLMRQLGVDVRGLLKPENDLLCEKSHTGVFHVAEARGSRFIPAQDDFVVPFEVESVVGFGDLLPDGNLFAVILFSRLPISENIAMLFSHLSLCTKAALIPFLSHLDDRPGEQLESLLQLVGNYEEVVLRQDKMLRSAVAAAESTAERLAFLSAIVESSDDAIIGKTLDGVITSWNRGAERLYGYAADEVIGQPIQIIVPEDRLEELEGLFDKLRSGRRVEHFDTVRRKKDGGLVDVSLSVSPIADEQGTLAGASAIARDVTQRKRDMDALAAAKEAAISANRAKSDFLANMSHEIRTPMNAIIGMTGLALETRLTRVQQGYLETVKQSADSLLELLNDILDFSKIEAGQLSLEAAPFSLRELVSKTAKAMAIPAHEKGLELIWDVSQRVPDGIIGDSHRLRQVLVNLIGNAIKFTERGEVVVQIAPGLKRDRDLMVEFVVTDTGIGIPPNRQKEIFAAFTQVDTSTTREFGGTGLGLSICSKLVEMMEGTIGLESEVGFGSRFRFTARFGLADEGVAPSATQDVASLDGVRVLVVDDNAANREVLRHLLANWGMAPVLAADANEALRHIDRAKSPFPVILVDCHMPRIDGFMLAEKIQQQSSGRSIIMMLTSGSHDTDIQRCRRLGIAAHMLKPVDPSELQEAILRTLSHDFMDGDSEWLRTTAAGANPMDALHVLLAEDNRVNRQLALTLLERMGHTATVAGNGQEALTILGQESFDIVLMDVQMPVMDGFEAATAIRAAERQTGAHIPIIALTARAMKGDRERCLEAGMDDYVSKPIDPQRLQETIERVLPAGRQAVESASTEHGERDLLETDSAITQIGGDRELLEELADLFLEEAPAMLARIEEAIARSDARQLEAAAHTLKGSVSSFFARSAEAAAERLELIGETRELDQAPEAFAALETALESIRPELSRMAERHRSRCTIT